MSGNSLFLGKKAIVDASGNVNFSDAVLLSKGSIVATQAEVATAKLAADNDIATAKTLADNSIVAADNVVRTEFAAADALVRTEFAEADNVVRAEFLAADAVLDAKLDAKIALLLDNLDPAALDSFTEVVTQARNMTGISRRGLTKLPLNTIVVPDEQQPIAKEFANFAPTDPKLGYDGWYFKNLVKGKKINWYAPAHIGMKNRDISGLVIDNWVINTVSAVFLTIYTKRDVTKTYLTTELPVGGSSWYKCKKTFIVDRSKGALVAGPSSFTVNLDSNAPILEASYAHKKVDMVMEEFTSLRKNAAGELVDLVDDEILAFSIGSDSGSAAGNVETIVKALKIQQSSGVNSFVFENADVLAEHMNKKTIALYKAFFGKDIMGLDTSFIPDAAPAPTTTTN